MIIVIIFIIIITIIIIIIINIIIILIIISIIIIIISISIISITASFFLLLLLFATLLGLRAFVLDAVSEVGEKVKALVGFDCRLDVRRRQHLLLLRVGRRRRIAQLAEKELERSACVVRASESARARAFV